MISCDKCKIMIKQESVFKRQHFDLCIRCVQMYDKKGSKWVLSGNNKK